MPPKKKATGAATKKVVKKAAAPAAPTEPEKVEEKPQPVKKQASAPKPKPVPQAPPVVEVQPAVVEEPQVVVAAEPAPIAEADAKAVSELTLKQKRMIRAFRFGKENEDGDVDPSEALSKIEEEKKRREERAARFGIETKDMAKQKRMERADRFKAGLPVEDDGAVGQQSRQIMDLDNNEDKIKARMERFGGE